MNEQLLNQILPDAPERVKNILHWVIKNSTLLSTTPSVRIELNSKGSHVTGTVTQYPDSK